MNIILPQYKKIDFGKLGLINNNSLTFLINLWDPNIKDPLEAEYVVRSLYIQQICFFQWVLNEDTVWQRNGKYIESFTEVPRDFTNFPNMQIFRMNFRLQVEDSNTFSVVSVNDLKTKNFPIQCNYKIKIQRKEGTYLPLLETGWSRLSEQYDVLRKVTEKEWDCLSTDWMVTSEIIVVTPCDGVIESVSYEPNIRNLSKKSTMPKRKEFSNQTLQQHMHNLYKEGMLCDVALRADSETFTCHKAIICDRSPVFKTMFETNMREKETNIVEINDIEPRILGKFLAYLYLDNPVNENFDLAVKLYAVADKYEVLHLQEDCANVLISFLSIENVCEVLDLADRHQDENIKVQFLLYFSEHTREIVNSSSWKKLLMIKPLLAAETLQAVVTNIFDKMKEVKKRKYDFFDFRPLTIEA